MDMLEVAHAKKAQSLVSDQDYRLSLHQYTALPDDLKLLAAKKAYTLQSEVRVTADSCTQHLLFIDLTTLFRHNWACCEKEHKGNIICTLQF